jgi:AraC-like DNA-binding protein
MAGYNNSSEFEHTLLKFQQNNDQLTNSVKPLVHLSYIPSEPLLNFIEDLWLYDGYISPCFRERILPSGTIELVINLREDELRIYDIKKPPKYNRFSGALVSGGYARFFVSDTAEEASIMGVHFKPGGAFPFLGIPAGELADAHVDLETLWGKSARELRERICLTEMPGKRFKILEAALLSHLFRPLKRHDAVTAAISAFANTCHHWNVRDVVRQIGLSHRRFIEVFTAETGLTPKLFSRIQRFQQARKLSQKSVDPDWAMLAVECGYYDQSHLIHDFLEFSGFSPEEYIRHLNGLHRQGLYIKRNHLPY